jgi:transposase
MRNRTRRTAVAAIGIDVGDKYTEVCVLDETGAVLEVARIRTTVAAFDQRFRGLPRAEIALEAGTHSPWIARLLSELGHQPIVANPRKLELIAKNDSKSDRNDAELLARLARFDKKLLSPIQPKSEEAQAVRRVLGLRDGLVRARSQLINTVRSTVKSEGSRIPKCSAEAFTKVVAEALPKPLVALVKPVLAVIEGLTTKIRKYDRDVESLGKKRFPITQHLQSIPGIGPVTSLAFAVTVGDPHRFKSSRAVGSYFGLRPRRDESGASAPELRITKSGDNLVRKLLVQGAQCLLNRGRDCALKRWGIKLAGRGRKNAKKKAVVAVARKLSVIMHRLWITGEVFEDFPAAAKQPVQRNE